MAPDPLPPLTPSPLIAWGRSYDGRREVCLPARGHPPYPAYMSDTEHFSRLLGLSEPWFVERVDLLLHQGRIDLWVSHRSDARLECPECGSHSPTYDHVPERVWRHLDTMQYQTLLHARIPRIRCDEHGIKQVKVPWSEPKSRFTILFEFMAINVLQETTISGACALLRLSWDEAFGIMKRAVARGLSRRLLEAPRYLGIDEKAAAKGHDYLTIISDLEPTRVLWVAPGRETESVSSYFRALPPTAAHQIRAVAMDMWPAYVKAVREYVPDADHAIVYDRFHVTRELVDAVDMVRKTEHRLLTREGVDVLSKTKYWWLHNKGNVPRKHRHSFVQLRQTELKTARAWAIKELFRRIWEYRTPARALAFWKRWYGWASRSRLEPIRRKAQKLRRNLQYILNYATHRITNATSESMNAQIDKIKRRAQGFRNRENFQTSIYFHCAKLDLYPRTH